MPLAPISGEGSTNPIEFKQKVTTNVELVIGRINGIALQYFCEEVSPCLLSHYVRGFLVKKDEKEGMDVSLSLFGCSRLKEG